MSHIDDARIEAYVDGAYDVLGPDLVDEIERRIREEPDLAERVRAARAVRAAASEILGLAAPSPAAAPPFHELQERAERHEAARDGGSAGQGGSAGDGGRRWVRIPPVVGLGWAATIILALGVGWFAGQSGAQPAAFEAADRDEVGQAEAFELGARVDGDATRTEAGAGVAPQPEPAVPATIPADNVTALEEAQELPVGVRIRRDLADAVPPAETEVAAEPARTERVEGVAEERARSARTEVDALMDAAGRTAPPAAQFRQSGDALGASVPTGGFADHTLHSLALPGLTVVGVGLKEEGALTGLEILHRLPTGDTLSLRYVGLFSETREPLGVDDARASAESLASISAQIQGAALARGWHQVVVRKEGRWVVARAPISEEEIRAYLMTLN